MPGEVGVAHWDQPVINRLVFRRMPGHAQRVRIPGLRGQAKKFCCSFKRLPIIAGIAECV